MKCEACGQEVTPTPPQESAEELIEQALSRAYVAAMSASVVELREFLTRALALIRADRERREKVVLPDMRGEAERASTMGYPQLADQIETWVAELSR